MENHRRTQAGRRRFTLRSRYGVRCGYMYMVMTCYFFSPGRHTFTLSDDRQQRRGSVVMHVTVLHRSVDSGENSNLKFYDSVGGGGYCAIFNAERRMVTHMT